MVIRIVYFGLVKCNHFFLLDLKEVRGVIEREPSSFVVGVQTVEVVRQSVVEEVVA